MSVVKDVFVSVVCALDPKQENLPQQLIRLDEILSHHYQHHEIVVMDGRRDALPANDLDSILSTIPMVRYLRVQKMLSDDALTAAGLENAIGDIVVSGRLELLSESNVVNAVAKCCEGNDVVCGVGVRTDTFAYRIASMIFRKMFGRMISYDVPDNDLSFRCVSRRIVNAALAEPHFHQFVFVRLSNAGGQQVELPLEVPAGFGVGRCVRNSFERAVSLLVFNTVKPMRIVNLLAICVSAACVGCAAYTVLVKLVKSHVVEGWPTMMLFLSAMFFFLFTILAFIGEYLVRVVLDRRDQQPYTIAYERHSSVMLDMSELNVRTESMPDSVNLTQTGRDR